MNWKQLFLGQPPTKKIVRLHHTNVDHSIEGTYEGHTEEHYIIENARLILNEKTNPQNVGTVWIPRANVSFMQVIGDFSTGR